METSQVTGQQLRRDPTRSIACIFPNSSMKQLHPLFIQNPTKNHEFPQHHDSLIQKKKTIVLITVDSRPWIDDV